MTTLEYTSISLHVSSKSLNWQTRKSQTALFENFALEDMIAAHIHRHFSGRCHFSKAWGICLQPARGKLTFVEDLQRQVYVNRSNARKLLGIACVRCCHFEVRKMMIRSRDETSIWEMSFGKFLGLLFHLQREELAFEKNVTKISHVKRSDAQKLLFHFCRSSSFHATPDLSPSMSYIHTKQTRNPPIHTNAAPLHHQPSLHNPS